MTTIYLIRHAEAEGNVFRRIHGQYDSLVTQNGLRQIAALRDRFRDIPIDAVYASDLFRTRKTAESICVPKNLTLNREPRFREVALGVWEDTPFGYLEKFEREDMWAFNHDSENWHVEGSETYSEYTGRFLNALKEAAEANDGRTIAVFTHGCVLRGVQFILAGQNSVPYCDNTAVSLLRYNGGQFQIDYLNDNSHLDESISTFARQKWWREKSEIVEHNMWFRPVGDDEKTLMQICRSTDKYMGGGQTDPDQLYEDSILNAFWDAKANAFGMLDDRVAGVVQLSPARYMAEKIGYISFLAMEESERGKTLGIQLLGYAVSYYRKKQRDRLRLSVSCENEAALRFFEKYGFSRLSGPAPEEKHIVLERSIAVK